MHRLDIVLDAKLSDDEFAVPPHGIIGQSFDGHGRPRKGKLDIYPPRSEPGEFWTKAMADWYNIVGEKCMIRDYQPSVAIPNVCTNSYNPIDGSNNLVPPPHNLTQC